MNIFELVQADNIKVIYEQSKNIPPYEGEMFFPNVRQKGLKFSFIKGKKGTPVALVSANWNTNVLYRDRIGVEKLSGSLPFFKEAKKIDEELRQEILSTKDEYADTLVNQVMDDEVDLLYGADVTAERMRMQLLSTGTININENGVNKQYDYGFSTENQFKTLSTKWNEASADVIKDLNEQLDAYEELTQETASYAIMSKKVFRLIKKNEKVLSYFANLSTPNLYPSDEQVKNFIQDQTNLTLIITSKKYLEARDFNGTPVPFYPEDRITLLSTLDLGQTVYGTTPEEADLLGGQSKASSVAVTEKGVAITTWNEVDPVNVNTKVSEVVIPTCPNLDLIYIVKVL